MDFDAWMIHLDIPANPAVRISGLMYKTAKAIAEVQDAIVRRQSSIPNDPQSERMMSEENMSSLVNRLQLLDLEFDSFEQRLPATWMWEENTPEQYSESLPRWTNDFRRSKVLVCHNFAIACTWNLWRATRIKLLHAWLDALALRDPPQSDEFLDPFDDPQLNPYADSSAWTVQPIDPHIDDSTNPSSRKNQIRWSIEGLMENICASALPQLTMNVNRVSNPATVEDACGSRDYKLTWALRVVHDTSVYLGMRDRLPWVENALRRIESDFSARL